MEQFLPIIIIAIISFLLNSKKKTPQQKQADRNKPARPVMQKPARQFAEQKQAKMPSERMDKEKGTFQVEMPRNLREAADILLTQIEPNPAIEEEKVRAERELKKLKKQAEAYEQKMRAVQKRAAEYTSAPNAEIKTSQKGLIFGQQNDIVRGIIMHEILGPPRALKRRIR